MKKVIKLKESDLQRIVKRVLNEQEPVDDTNKNNLSTCKERDDYRLKLKKAEEEKRPRLNRSSNWEEVDIMEKVNKKYPDMEYCDDWIKS
jgi:hypothetical protein